MRGIAVSLGEIVNGVLEVLNQVFERRDDFREIILRVFKIILGVRKILVLYLAKPLAGLREFAANAAVFFCGVDVVGNDRSLH